MVQYTDERYAQRIQAVQAKIDAYIAKIGNIRDSFGNKFSAYLDGDWYFGSSSGSILMNPTRFGGTFWAGIEDILGKPYGMITPQQFQALATNFARLDTLDGQERFLNLLTIPIENPRDSMSIMDVSGLLNTHAIFQFCQQRASRIAFYMEHQIASELMRQKNMRAIGLEHESVDPLRQTMQLNHTLLTAFAGLQDMGHMLIGHNDADRRSSPISLSERPGGGVDANIHITFLHQVGSNELVSMGMRMPGTEGPPERHISISPPRVSIDLALQNVENQHFQWNSQFSMTHGMVSGVAGVALGAIPKYGTLLSAGMALNGLINSSSNMEEAMRNQELSIYHRNLSNFHMKTQLEGSVVVFDLRGSNTPPEVQIVSWLTARTPESLSALNEVAGTDISWEEFLRNPQMGVGLYVGMDEDERNRFGGVAIRNHESATITGEMNRLNQSLQRVESSEDESGNRSTFN